MPTPLSIVTATTRREAVPEGVIVLDLVAARAPAGFAGEPARTVAAPDARAVGPAIASVTAAEDQR